MHLEAFGLGQACLGQPLANVFTLITLQLKDLTVFGMLDDGAVACELLLACAYDLLEIVFRRQTLDRGQCFASVTLLDTNVDESVLDVIIESPDGIREWIA